MRPLWSIGIAGVMVILLAVPAMPVAAATYYVAPAGADSALGTALRPWRSIAAAALRVRPGDLVVVQAGVYYESVVLTRSGQAGAPIVFRGLPGAVLASPDPSASLSAFDISAPTAFVTIQGFELGGGFAETVFLRSGAHDIELAGLHIHDNHTGIWIGGASDVFVHDCQIEHNYRTGIRMFDGARRIRIVDTVAAHNDDGAGCDGASDGFNTEASVEDVVFERASAIGNSQDGFDLKGPNVTLLGATAEDNGCTGVKVWAGGYLENVVVQRHNVGVCAGGADRVTTVLQNCTLSQNALGVRVLSSEQTVFIRNSIVSGEGKAVSYESPAQLVEHHNIFFRPRSTDRLIVHVQGAVQTLYSGDDINGGRWQGDSGQGQETIAADPKVDASGVPAADSPAIDRGDLSGSPVVDRVGTPRPQGAAVDRGAFERPAGSPILLVQSIVVRSDRAGSGRVRLLAHLGSAGSLCFDARADTVMVSIRGAGGEITHLTVTPSVRSASFATSAAAPRWLHADSDDRLQEIKLITDTSGARILFSATVADVWACDGAALSITIQVGSVRATAEMPLEAIGTLMSGDSGRRLQSPRRR